MEIKIGCNYISMQKNLLIDGSELMTILNLVLMLLVLAEFMATADAWSRLEQSSDFLMLIRQNF